MSFLNKHKTEAAVNTAPAADGLTGTAEDVDAVMKKYDRESNVRVWEGKPKTVIRFLMAAFSLYCIYLTLFDRGLPEVRLTRFLAMIILIGSRTAIQRGAFSFRSSRMQYSSIA